MRSRLGLAALLASLALAACQSSAGKSSLAAPIGRNVIACRKPETVTALAGSGAQFQRMADNEMASGNCRVFEASHPVRDRSVERAMLRFSDPGTGFVYWAGQAG